MSSFPRLRKLRSKRHSLRNQKRRSTAILARIMPSLGIMGHTTMPRQQPSPTDGQGNFYISNCGDLRSFLPVRTTGAPSPSARTGVVRRAEKSSRERPEQSRTDAILQFGQGPAARKETRDDKKNRDRAVQSDDFQAGLMK